MGVHGRLYERVHEKLSGRVCEGGCVTCHREHARGGRGAV